MYGIKSVHDAGVEGDGDEEGDGEDEIDIEAAIQKEVAALNAKPSTAGSEGGDHANRMTSVKMNVDCLLFVKTQPPVDPVAFVRRICEDAKRCGELPGLMRCRYVNRLTPVSVMGKATEGGLVEVAKEALGAWFDLSGKRAVKAAPETEVSGEDAGKSTTEETPEAAADARTEVAAAETSGSDPEIKPFTVSSVLTVCWVCRADSLAVRHPADHSQSQQLEARRGDQHDCRPHQ